MKNSTADDEEDDDARQNITECFVQAIGRRDLAGALSHEDQKEGRQRIMTEGVELGQPGYHDAR